MEPFRAKPLTDERNEFLEQTRQARQKRVDDQKRLESVLVMQRSVRSFLAYRIVKRKVMEKFENVMIGFCPEENRLVKSRDVFHASNLVFKFCKSVPDLCMLEKLCRYVTWSMSQPNPCYSYIGPGFNKESAIVWIEHLKTLVSACLQMITKLKPELVSDSKLLSLFLTTLVALTALDRWQIFQSTQFQSLIPGIKKLNQTLLSHMKSNSNLFSSLHVILEAALARPGKFFLKKANLLAIVNIINRALLHGTVLDGDSLVDYVFHILTVPAYVYYVNSMCPEALNFFGLLEIAHIIVTKSDQFLKTDSDLSKTLSLLANFVHLGQVSQKLSEHYNADFASAIRQLLNTCGKNNESSKKSHWHPILGWVDHSVSSSLLNSVSTIKTQLEFLWGPVYLEAIFHTLSSYLRERNLDGTDKELNLSDTPKSPREKGGFLKTSFVRIFKKALLIDTQGSSLGIQPHRFTSEFTLKISESCDLFSAIISTFSICRLDILTGICFKQSSKWLVSLWKFFLCFGRDPKYWIDVLLQNTRVIQESFIVLFSDAMIHYITMLDDQEMYVDQKGFKLTDLTRLAHLINQLCYRLITNPNISKLREGTWMSLKTLLMVLYRRDCRKKYCPDEHWLIEPLRSSFLIVEINRGRKNAKRVLLDMPHVLREDSRVVLFRKWTASEKTLNGNSGGEHDSLVVASTLITIQRGRIVEDGYAQLATLTPKALKGTIRVRFQNELGLDEAGIDQDGVFKEFLEETISAVFNPSLNLFKATNENLLYPSPLSYLHENHLQLFEFVGKMLAKAIYEGIVVDVHFAPFFMSQILAYQQNALFSAIDELQSLDRELYSSLNYIKHYDGNVQDLELSFSVDQDFLGEIRTTELIPGGRSIAVTNQNKISYLYLMAHFHLYVQIKDQTAAFLKGFRSIIPNEWIKIFSPPELQRLISGEDSDIDLDDLRRNTQYYGGFHDNHRVVVWLWDILQNDFDENERRLFLKFTTSCSKPPLLGFTNLDPPFSIRCVEVSDDEDTGDTIGSVLRGFLTIGRKDPVGRLPTSSTCFNLLKLPNYQKKSTLRDKLKYAINANVGFELS